MGLLKFVGKTIGSAALVVTGTTAALLRTAACAAGKEETAETAGSIQDASFEKIREMWTPKKHFATEEEAEEYYEAQEQAREERSVARAESAARDGEQLRRDQERARAKYERMNAQKEAERKRGE